MTALEILMLNGCTKSEAEEHLNNGTIVFEGEDFKKHFDFYMDEWDIDEDERTNYKDMIDKKQPLIDWGIVENGNAVYFIQYVL